MSDLLLMECKDRMTALASMNPVTVGNWFLSWW